MPQENTPNNIPHRVAVMDLGTNTFHLLIAEGTPDNIKAVWHQTEAVKIGEGGITKGIIQPAAFARGVKCMEQFRQQISDSGANTVRAIGTSALRNAANSQDFIDKVLQKTGIQIELITGEQEAAYIYKGIAASGCLTDENALIVDIGGGSVEFIFGNRNEILWKQSFEIGAARLMAMFHQKDPIPVQSIKEMSRYLTGTLTGLFMAAIEFKPTILVGSSGAFESFAEVIETEQGRPFNPRQTKTYDFDTDDLLGLIERIAKSNHVWRAGKRGIIPVRVDMIVSSSLLTIFIMQKLGLVDVSMSTWSLKEGVMAEMLA
ncbi:exopolyphosphatase [Mucilaginibacter terrenus]|uniref:Exopolyphosphatase n=1 Tax=Mucilaginibacter terrenus TaxID=2482727 RepID=A0A3E2NX22_9SPHI|nr:exopolyphosphatase [Mucilaginibacter terrenus]RFZ85471.1 exopolyphosphatase [Mucilaginibacter terrenus]